LSSSVADALQFLQTIKKDFKKATATIKFIRIFDQLFDLMNVRNSFGKLIISISIQSIKFIIELEQYLKILYHQVML